jgi:arsenate reductase (thioredoxin)
VPAASSALPTWHGSAVPVELDVFTKAHIAKQIDDLALEFEGVFSRETVNRYVQESLDGFATARFSDFLPLLVYRYSRERLSALGQAEGRIVKTVPEVLFVCVQNAGRSQMAAALLKRRAEGRVHIRSAGSTPAEQINSAVVEALGELGIDVGEEFPKPLSDEVVRAADVVITMGCGDACPIYPGKRYEDWQVDDPEGKELPEVRSIRDEIDRRVTKLLGEIA